MILLVAATLGIVLLIALRLYSIRLKPPLDGSSPTSRVHKTMIILGSGGHTTEMLAIVKALNREWYTPRIYIIAHTDTTSESKVTALEAGFEDYSIHRIFRSRAVHQSYMSSIFTTINSIIGCIPLVYHVAPNLILSNGPGTCVPVCFIAFVFNFFAILRQRIKIMFIESYCRVRTISLSGKILIWFVDLFVVQWPQLKIRYKDRVVFYGRLM